jgi:ketosteroid isomerase-like protein
MTTSRMMPEEPTTLIERRAGKIARVRSFLDHAEALRAAGLSDHSEQADG